MLADDSKAENEAKIRGYDEPLALFKKAAELGDGYSMYRIGHLYFYDLDDNKSAIGWYIKAIEHGYADMDCYYEYANVSTRLYGNQSTDGPKYYEKWGKMCEDGFDTISRRHLDLYIEALERGRYGQKRDIQKAIDVCKRALSQNNPEFGRTPTRYGVRHKLATLYEQTGDKKSAIEQYEIYIQELKDGGEYLFDCYEIELKLIKYYFEGDGIEADYTKAKQIIDIILSDNPSDSVASYYLGQYYEEGLASYQKDVYKAFECYEKAAKRVPEAMRKLGIMFLYGIGCEKSKKQARAYLTQAKSKGVNVSPYLEKASSWF